MTLVPLHMTWSSPEDYRSAYQTEISRGGLLVRGATLIGGNAGAEVLLTLSVVGGNTVSLPATVAAVVPDVGVAVMFSGDAPALKTLGSAPVDSPQSDRPPAALSERLKEMTVHEKMQLALTGTRDERAALLRDANKSLHLFVLKNPRIALDEIQAAAKSPLVSPEALKAIADHREWGTNPAVCVSLVRNPKTPMPLALRALERVPLSDLKAIAKGGARDQLVHAARKKLAE